MEQSKKIKATCKLELTLHEANVLTEILCNWQVANFEKHDLVMYPVASDLLERVTWEASNLANRTEK